MFKTGFPRKMTFFMVWSSLPLIKWGKKLSAVPVLKWIIAPFFRYPHNEVTAVPVNVEVARPGSAAIPRELLARVLSQIDDIFLLEECVCRKLHPVEGYPASVGCMALGPAARMIHPSHGRRITPAEAAAHVEKASRAGLVASVAHTWIDAVGFGIRPFSKLMFICFCDDTSCIFRSHMKKRGPNLNLAYKKLPGVSISIDASLCDGCGICVEKCFAAEMKLADGKASPSNDCKACGRCAELCPRDAIAIVFEDEEKLYRTLVERVKAVADVGL
ncbi:MAG: 4Fe-4S binding protein [Spirochaetes bacterium]|nr:4Fe-4S binding protein [Spirochaetota bacterium]